MHKPTGVVKWHEDWGVSYDIHIVVCIFQDSEESSPSAEINNTSYFFPKISGIGPCVSRINWCERQRCDSIYMVVRLSDVTTGKKCIFCVFACFRPYIGQPDNHLGWATSLPYTSIHPTDPSSNPWNFCEKILRIGRDEKLSFLSQLF